MFGARTRAAPDRGDRPGEYPERTIRAEDYSVKDFFNKFRMI